MSDKARYLPDGFPVPEVTEFSRAFHTSGTLAVQTCKACRSVQHPPGDFCFSCGGMEFDYVETAARGVISSHTIVHHATHPLLVDRVPYNVVIVELEAHPHVRIVGNVLDAAADEVRIGRQVVGCWTAPLERVGQDPVRLLQWKLAPS
ncbi:Zn-ribbon domain-containing OB-fold protein [Rhodococcus sp. NPDC003322]